MSKEVEGWSELCDKVIDDLINGTGCYESIDKLFNLKEIHKAMTVEEIYELLSKEN